MSHKRILIADSGGTSTTWIHSTNENWVFEMESLHPRRIHELGLERVNELKNVFSSIEFDEVHFYGAGCSSEIAQEKTSSFLSSLGLVNVLVFSDGLLACRATLGNKKGYVAIMGTGSVLFYFDGTAITESFGGYGPVIGDEGGGMAFGKLFLKKYLLNFDFFSKEIKEIIGSRKEVLTQLSLENSLKYISSLAEKLNSFELTELHELNIDAFISSYFPKIENEKIHVIGSYGFYQRRIIEKSFKKKSWNLEMIIQSPLASVRRTYYNGFGE